MDEFDDPEMSYWRGFHQGAWLLFAAIEPYLPPDRATAARDWIQKEVSLGGSKICVAKVSPDRPASGPRKSLRQG
jgi:hypothetical protein